MPARLLARLRARLRFANVVSATALFVALGGTSYAAVSIGSAEIRTGAVGKSEIRTGAVGKSEIRSNAVGKSEIATDGVGAAEVRKDAIDTTELRDGGVELADLSAATRTALTLTDRTAVTSTGKAAGGNAKAVARTAVGTYSVEFAHDVSGCTASATLAAVKDGTTLEEPPAGGTVAVAPRSSNTTVVVKTYGAPKLATPAPSQSDPTPQPAVTVETADAPFHLVLAC